MKLLGEWIKSSIAVVVCVFVWLCVCVCLLKILQVKESEA